MRTGRIVLGLAAALLVAGCGGFGGSADKAGSASEANDDSGGGTSSSDVAAPDDARAALAGPTDEEAAKTGNSARVLPADRSMVYRGELSVRVRNVEKAVIRAEGRVRAADGTVSAEETSADASSGRASAATMTLRVPPAAFRQVLADLADLGKRLSTSQNAQDVTTKVVDVESRVESQRRSVARVRALLDEAKTIGEVVQVEGELTRREADLESLEAQRKALEDVTAMATIELSLVAPDVDTPKGEDDDLGFLGGLQRGWDAFAGSVVVALTVLGAVLPFAATVLLLGFPVWLVLRRRRSATIPATQPADGLPG